jgi:LysM repeat protein
VYERPRARIIPNLIGAVSLLVCVGCVVVVLAPRFTGINLPFGLPVTATPEPPPTATLAPPAVSTPTVVREPTITPGFSPTPSQRASFQYTVVEGDTLYSIALANGLTVEQLAAANGKVSDSLSIGEVLVIPAEDYQPPTATPIPPDLPAGTELQHVIKIGETLDTIAAAYLSTVDSILALNEEVIVDPASLPVGSTIVVRYGLITPTPVVAPTSGGTALTPAASSTPAG